MGAMTATITARTLVGLERGRPLRVEDLARFPDDGRCYELIDGTLIVTPAPQWEHAEVVVAIAVKLRNVCPKGIRSLAAPLAVTFGLPDTEVQPDVVVARYDDLGPPGLPAIPLLVVEVRSPSTAKYDRTLKMALYERERVPAYWIVDPGERTITVFELVEGRYRQVAHVGGDQTVSVERPFAFTISPAQLCRGLDPD